MVAFFGIGNYIGRQRYETYGGSDHSIVPDNVSETDHGRMVWNVLVSLQQDRGVYQSAWNPNQKETQILVAESIPVEKMHTSSRKMDGKTPQKVRQGAIFDFVAARKAVITNVRRSNVRRFQMSFRTKKDVSQSVVVMKQSCKIVENGTGIKMLSKLFQG